MGWFDFMTRSNREEEIEYRNEHYKAMIKSQMKNGGAGGNSSDMITEVELLKIPAVQAIIEIITGTIAQLPINLYKDNGDGSIEQINDDYRLTLLNDEPNKFQNGYNFKKNMVKNYIIHGKYYIYKNTDRNEIISLHGLNSENVTVRKFYKNGFLSDAELVVSTEEGEGEEKILGFDEVISILKDSDDGITGKGALYYGNNLLDTVGKQNDFTKGIYENGAMPLGILKSENRLTKSTIERMRESWQNLYGGAKNIGKTIILEEGLDYKPVSLNPKDLLLNETKKEALSDLCRLFNIPESLINPSANKYGSLEQNNIFFLQYTLSPIVSAIETALNKSMLLTEEKKNNLFFAFDTSEVLRTTEKERFEAIKVGLDTGVITMNEARYKLNLKGISDDVMKWSLGAVLYYPETGEMKIPNTGVGITKDTNQEESMQNVKLDNTDIKEETKESDKVGE